MLGAGGITGIAWLTGYVHALAESGVPLIDASLILGTSAGATLGAQFAARIEPSELFARQVESGRQVAEIEPSAELVNRLIAAAAGEDDIDTAARLARRALLARATPDDGGKRQAVIAHRLGRDAWPSLKLKLCAVDVDSRELVTFDAASGVSLHKAVAASCAVPGIWPPVRIGERLFMDGGVRSVHNADVAAGWEKVLVLAPIARPGSSVPESLDETVRALQSESATVMAVTPDDVSKAACGANPFSSERRAEAARAGYEQARRSLEAVREFWT